MISLHTRAAGEVDDGLVAVMNDVGSQLLSVVLKRGGTLEARR